MRDNTEMENTEKKDIRLIAFDLDETLLNTDKTLSEENRQALLRASEAGIYIVPATGRIFCGMPECVRELPLRYTIAANGALVTEVGTDNVIYNAYLPNERTVALMKYFDTLPVAYDCYMDGKSYMAKQFIDDIERYIGTPAYIALTRWLRTPVPYLPDHVQKLGIPVQKVQLFTRDPVLKEEVMKGLSERFPDLCVTTSTPENVEISDKRATKGAGLLALCGYLGISPDQVMAFGDGLNDIPMLKEAGIGVAMANACEQVRAVADHITLSNNESGVAAAIRKFCF